MLLPTNLPGSLTQSTATRLLLESLFVIWNLYFLKDANPSDEKEVEPLRWQTH